MLLLQKNTAETLSVARDRAQLIFPENLSVFMEPASLFWEKKEELSLVDCCNYDDGNKSENKNK